LLLVDLSRFHLALDRLVAEQNRSRFVPQIAVTQDSQMVGLVNNRHLAVGAAFHWHGDWHGLRGGSSRIYERG